MKHCNKNYNLIAYLRDEIFSQKEKELIKEHLKICSDCQDELIRLNRLFEALKNLPVIDPSPDFEYRVMEAVNSLEQTREVPSLVDILRSRFSTLRYLLRYAPPWAISVGVHILLFAIFGLILVTPTQEEFRRSYIVSLEKAKHELLDVIPDDIHTTLGTGELVPSEIPPSLWPTPSVEISPEIRTKQHKPIEIPDWAISKPLFDRLDTKIEEGFIAAIYQRSNEIRRRQALVKYGGNGVEKSIAQGLAWLALTQNQDGSWEPEKFQGRKEYQIGLTGLALLAFLAQGNSSLSGAYQTTVAKGIQYLVAQKSLGLIGPSRVDNRYINYMYNHALASLALLENYYLTGRREPSTETINEVIRYILLAQNERGGWGYQARNEVSDTSVTAWVIQVLRLAKPLNIPGVTSALKKASEWLVSVTDHEGKVGYRAFGQYPNGYYALTAAGMACQLFIGWDKSDKLIQAQEKLVTQKLPQFNSFQLIENDFYFWYFATQALFLKGGESWTNWNKWMKKTLIETQMSDGSWGAFDRWSIYGGRLYTTSMALLILQVYYRYPRE